MRLSRRALAALILCLCLIALVLLRRPVLWAVGGMLVNDGPPQKADIVVVLGGDWKGNRILKAAELVREGYAPRALVSGAGGFFGHHESSFAISFAAERGYPRDTFVPFTYPALATLDEARNDAAEMRRLGVHTFLLVTSPWHTARSVRIFHSVAPDLEVHAVGSVDPHWHNGEWWIDREGRKIWLLEELKTVAGAIGM